MLQELSWINMIPSAEQKSVMFATFNKTIMRCQYLAGLGSSTVDQVLKYTKYPKYIPSTSTGQVLIFLKST